MVEGGSGYLAEHNVKFPKITAGGILEHTLTGGQKDSSNVAINSEWVPSQSNLLIKGKDISFDSLGNTADPEQIASPDNLKFSEKLRTLFIGEDSGNHLNNFLWAYNVDTKQLIRILSTPAGAESTGLHAVDEVNGWTYIMSNFQHPGDEWNRFYKEKMVFVLVLAQIYSLKLIPQLIQITVINLQQQLAISLPTQLHHLL